MSTITIIIKTEFCSTAQKNLVLFQTCVSKLVALTLICTTVRSSSGSKGLVSRGVNCNYCNKEQKLAWQQNTPVCIHFILWSDQRWIQTHVNNSVYIFQRPLTFTLYVYALKLILSSEPSELSQKQISVWQFFLKKVEKGLGWCWGAKDGSRSWCFGTWHVVHREWTVGESGSAVGHISHRDEIAAFTWICHSNGSTRTSRHICALNVEHGNGTVTLFVALRHCGGS